jgi:hypothetical protein
MGLFVDDISDEDDLKAALLTAALSNFPKGVSPASLSITEICKAAVTTTAFTIQTVFQEEDVVRRCRNKPKVTQWFDKVIKGANSS